MRYRVYIEDVTIIFAVSAPRDTSIVVWRVEPGEQITITKLLQKVQFTKLLWIITPEVEEIFAQFVASQQLVEAGGGIVENPNGDILMIHRNGRWDLPKGKLEKDEKIEDCAVREVEEECAIFGVIRGRFVGNTYHCYRLGDSWALKQTSWYSMRYNGNLQPQGQAEEGITFAGWVNLKDIPSKLQRSYATIRDIFTEAGYIF